MSAINRAIGIGVILLLVSVLLPESLLMIAMVDTSGWNPAVVVIFQTVVPILSVVGIIYLFMRSSYKRGSLSVNKILQIAVALMILASVFPIGITSLATMKTATTVTIGGNPVTYTIAPAVKTLVQVLLPILAAVGVAVGFLTVGTYFRRRR